MKLRMPLVMLALCTTVVLSLFYLFETAGAATTGTVTPSVTVSSTLSLTIEDGANVQWGSKAAGTTQTGTIQARVGSNTNWTLTVASDTTYGLAGQDGNNHVASARLTYSTAARHPRQAVV